MWSESMIQSFLILAETGNFTEAAQRRYFTQQALSKQIAKLEKALDCKLFVRERYGAKLTREGEIYRDAFQEAMDRIGQANAEVNGLSGGQNNTIHLGHLEMLAAEKLWNPFIRKFRQRYPQIAILTTTFPDGAILDAFQDGSMDAVVTIDHHPEVKDKSVKKLLLEEGKMFLCIHQDFPGVAEAKSYEDLRNVPVFFPTSGPKHAIERMESMGFPEKNIRLLPNITTAVLAVEMLEGAIMIADHCEFSSRPHLKLFPLPWTEGQVAKVILMWHPDRMNGALRLLVAELRELLNEEE